MESKKIVHLHLKSAEPREADYYFGSIMAIYDVFSNTEIGIKYDSLCIALNHKQGRYENKYVIINIGEIRRRTRQM